MTVLNVTVTPRFAVLTQDTYGTLNGQFAGFVQKMHAIPHRRLVVGSTGSLSLAKLWADTLNSDPTPDEIGNLNASAPDRLRVIWAAAPVAVRSLGLGIAHVGYDEAAGRCIGFFYDARRDFESQQIDETVGHFIQPGQLDSTDLTYQVIRHRRDAALRGLGVEAFHQHLAANQYSGWARGLLQFDTGIGGDLQLAHVDSHGVQIRTTAKFPNYRALQRPGNRGASVGPLVATEVTLRSAELTAAA